MPWIEIRPRFLSFFIYQIRCLIMVTWMTVMMNEGVCDGICDWDDGVGKAEFTVVGTGKYA